MNDLPNLLVYPTKFNITIHVDEDKSNLMPAIDITFSIDSQHGKRAISVGYIDIPSRVKDTDLRSYPIDTDFIVIDYNKNTKEVLGIEMLAPPSDSMTETEEFIESCNDPALIGAASIGFTAWNSIDIILTMIDDMNQQISDQENNDE